MWTMMLNIVKYSQQLQAIKENYATFGVPYNGTDNDDYVDGEGFCCDDGSLEAAQAEAVAKANALDGNFQEGDAYENLQFYYHADHLGSTSYITNLDGEVVQHVEYVPFGEVFIEERNNTWNTPYLFNAKEFDEETGLYYYGARYYDPRLSVWMSTDPLQEKYINISTYCYAFYNPSTFVDLTGKEGEKSEKLKTNRQEDGKKFQLDNVSDVNYRTEATPDESRKTRNSHAYEYDANGNLVYVNTGRTKKDGTTDEKAHERKQLSKRTGDPRWLPAAE